MRYLFDILGRLEKKMEKTKQIKVVKKLNVTDLSGEKVMVDFEQGKYFMIKGAGNEIWDMIKDGISGAEIIDDLLKKYDVNEEICEKETMAFLNQLEEFGIIKGE